MIFREIEKRENYTLVRIGGPLSLAEMDEASVWCIRSQCGKRVNMNTFAFKTDEEVTMFTLRWRTQ